jgi:hypothetical protein
VKGCEVGLVMKIGSSIGDGIKKLFSSELKVIIVG